MNSQPKDFTRFNTLVEELDARLNGEWEHASLPTLLILADGTANYWRSLADGLQAEAKRLGLLEPIRTQE